METAGTLMRVILYKGETRPRYANKSTYTKLNTKTYTRKQTGKKIIKDVWSKLSTERLSMLNRIENNEEENRRKK